MNVNFDNSLKFNGRTLLDIGFSFLKIGVQNLKIYSNLYIYYKRATHNKNNIWCAFSFTGEQTILSIMGNLFWSKNRRTYASIYPVCARWQDSTFWLFSSFKPWRHASTLKCVAKRIHQYTNIYIYISTFITIK